MKSLVILPLMAGVLASCSVEKPVNVPVSQGGAILHGTYLGTAAELRDAERTGTSLPVQLTATATYVSAQQYRASGTLKLGETTYSFTGTGKGNFLVRLTPQYSPARPGVEFAGDLLLDGQKVGTLKSAYLHSPADTRQDLTLQLGEGWAHWYSLELDREK
jgi:hypothetical protein